MKELQRIIGHDFKDEALLDRALTHSSFANEKTLPENESYERLEFLGDAVLELAVSAYIFNAYPELSEGDMTKFRASIVCEPTLAKKARALSLGKFMKTSKGEAQNGGNDRDSILCDVFESVIGAVYLDAGFEAARSYIIRHLESEIKATRKTFQHKDSKTYLQEILQRDGAPSAEYAIVSEKGPDHDKIFVTEVYHMGKFLGRGQGRNKKESEQSAAADALRQFE